MADIKYDIVEEIGFPGMEQLQNTISGIGLRNMKR